MSINYVQRAADLLNLPIERVTIRHDAGDPWADYQQAEWQCVVQTDAGPLVVARSRFGPHGVLVALHYRRPIVLLDPAVRVFARDKQDGAW